MVTTVAGQPGVWGGAEVGAGIDAQFRAPLGVAVDSAGNLFVADAFNHMIQQISPGGVVSALAGQRDSFGRDDGTPAHFSYLNGLAVDKVGNLYLSDYY